MFSSIKRTTSRKILFAILALLSLLVGVACTQAPTRGWSGPTVASGPVAAEDTLYVGTLGGKVIALKDIYENDDPTSIWGQGGKGLEIGASKGGGLFACGSGISTPMSTYGTPAIAGGKVYIGGYDGHVYSFTTDGDRNEFDTGSSIIGSPIVAGDTLFVGNSDGDLYALHLDLNRNETEEPKWVFPTGDKIWATPAVFNGVVYIGSCDDKLYAIDIETGKEIWHFKAEGAFLSTPAIANDTIYIGACDRKFYAIEVATEDERQKALSRSGKEAAPSKAANWVFDKAKNWFWTQALVYNGKVWVGSLDKNVYAISESGPEEYSDIVCRTEGVVQTPPVLMASLNRILVGSEDGNIWAIDPQIEGDSGRVLYLEAGEPILAPMYADQEKGILFFHAQDGTHTLYALKVEATDKVDELKVTPLWNRRTDK